MSRGRALNDTARRLDQALELLDHVLVGPRRHLGHAQALADLLDQRRLLFLRYVMAEAEGGEI